MSLMENIKQKRCYLAFDYDTELTSTAKTDKYKTNVLTDGNIITAGADISVASKLLFQPSPTGKEASGFHDTSFQSFTRCDMYTRK